MRTLSLKSVAMLLGAIAGLGVLYWGVLQWDRLHVSKASADEPDDITRVADLISLSDRTPNTIHFTPLGLRTVGIETVEVKPAPLRNPSSCRDRSCWTPTGWCEFTRGFLESWFLLGRYPAISPRLRSLMQSLVNCVLEIGWSAAKSSRSCGARISERKRASWSTPFRRP